MSPQAGCLRSSVSFSEQMSLAVPKTSIFGTSILGVTKHRRYWLSEPSFSEGFQNTLAAIGQTVGSRDPSAPLPSTSPDKQLVPEAPVGHRQPRADQVPPEKNLMGDPNDPINRENAALDRMVRGGKPAG
jgi:hypothetical protein